MTGGDDIFGYEEFEEKENKVVSANQAVSLKGTNNQLIDTKVLFAERNK